MKRIFSNTCNILAVVMLSTATLSSCADDEQLGMTAIPEAVAEAENTANAQPALSPEQQLMKQNLDAAAQQLLTLVNTNNVRNELYQLDYDRIKTDRLRISELMEQPSKGGAFGALAAGIARTFDAGAKGGNADLLDYLKVEGCELYLPLPLDFYEEGTPITVVGHPLDKKAKQSDGYVIDMATGGTKRVAVDEEYIINNPILIVQPMYNAPAEREYTDDDRPGGGRRPGNELISLDPGNDVGGGGGGGTYTPTKPIDPILLEKVYEVSIKELRCAMSPNFWEGPIELRIGRVRVGEIVEKEEITIPYMYIKSAYHGWSHANGGWFDLETPIIWDCRWDKEYDSQAFFAYDHDPESFVKDITVSLKFKDYVSVNATAKPSNVKFDYEGDLIGHKVWDRTWFIKYNYDPNDTRNEWPVLRVGCLQMMIRGRML